MPHDAPARPRSTLSVLGAAVTSGLAGYLVLVLAARGSRAPPSTPSSSSSGAPSSGVRVLIGITTETTRTVFAQPQTRPRPPPRSSPSPWAPGGPGGRRRGVGPGLGPAPLRRPGAACSPPSSSGSALPRARHRRGRRPAPRSGDSYGLLVGLESVARLVLVAVAVALGAHGARSGLGGRRGLRHVAAAGGSPPPASAPSGRSAPCHARRARTPPGRGRVPRPASRPCCWSASRCCSSATTPDDVSRGARRLILAVSLCRGAAAGAARRLPERRRHQGGHARAWRRSCRRGGGSAAHAGGGGARPGRSGPVALRLSTPTTTSRTARSSPASWSRPAWSRLLTVTGAAAVALDHHAVYLVGWLVAATGGDRRPAHSRGAGDARSWSRCSSARWSGSPCTSRLAPAARRLAAHRPSRKAPRARAPSSSSTCCPTPAPRAAWRPTPASSTASSAQMDTGPRLRRAGQQGRRAPGPVVVPRRGDRARASAGRTASCGPSASWSRRAGTRAAGAPTWCTPRRRWARCGPRCPPSSPSTTCSTGATPS